MGYSGIKEGWFKAWKKSFVDNNNRQPTMKECFDTGWELQAYDNQGYSIEQAIKEYWS